MPRTEKNLRVRAETSLVEQRSGEVVPGDIGTAVNTDDLVVRKLVVLVLCHEPLHTQQVQVPLIRILLQLADLKTRRRDTAVAVAGTIAAGACAADTGDGGVSTRLAGNQAVGNLINLPLDDGVLRMTSVLVVGSVLEGDCELEESEKCEQHGGHVLGLAEVCHGENDAMLCTFRKQRPDEGQSKRAEMRLKSDACPKERNDVGSSPRSTRGKS